MKYGSEILKIVEAGLEKDIEKIKAYTKMSIEKLKNEECNGHIIECLEHMLDGSYKDLPKICLCGDHINKEDSICETCAILEDLDHE